MASSFRLQNHNRLHLKSRDAEPFDHPLERDAVVFVDQPQKLPAKRNPETQHNGTPFHPIEGCGVT